MADDGALDEYFVAGRVPLKQADPNKIHALSKTAVTTAPPGYERCAIGSGDQFDDVKRFHAQLQVVMQRLSRVEADNHDLKVEVHKLRAENRELKSDNRELKSDNRELKSEVKKLRAEQRKFQAVVLEKLSNLENRRR